MAPPGAATLRIARLPSPRCPSALIALVWISVLLTTGMTGLPARPSSAGSKPSCWPTHWRPAERPTMFDMVAPLVVVPTQSAGISNISFSQRTAACSVCTEAGFAVQSDPC